MALIGIVPQRSSRVPELAVTTSFELYREVLVAGLGDAPPLQYVHVVRLDIAQQALVMGDHDNRPVWRALLVDAARHHLQRVDIESAVGFVEDCKARLQHGHLKDLVALFLATRETHIDGALQQIFAYIQQLELGAYCAKKLAGIKLGLAAMAALSIHRGAQEIHVVHTWDLNRILNGGKPHLARSFLR